jgi:hypothetical protein
MLEPIILKDNGQTRLVIQRSTFKGTERLDVRRYYLADDGEWRPTRQGVSVPMNEADEFIEALTEAVGEVD